MRLGQSRTRLHERCIVSTETARAGVGTCKIYNNLRHNVSHKESWFKCMTFGLNMT